MVRERPTQVVVLTKGELSERATLVEQIVSKANRPKEKIYKGCVIRGSDPGKVARLRALNIKESKLRRSSGKRPD